MTAPLDGAQRTALGNLIQKARSLLEADLASTLEGDFGIHHSDGRIEEVHKLSLDASQAAVRIDLLDIVGFLRSEGETELAAVERLIREAAFTHVNRLVALRVAEGLGVLPEAIGRGLASQGFRDFAEVAPASADEEWERFRLFVRICADEMSADVPALFDPRNPLLELEPSTAAFSELIELFVAADETIWSAPDALGWSYQFFNSAEERKEMRKSSAPRNSRELAVRNQFFTPSYVVEFLVQNGLGAHLAASFPALADELPLLVEVPERPAEPIDLREVSALDPACGSGHFLLGAYDVLEAAWRHAGVEPEDAAPDIVRSLWGIDIDPRATQIAQAAVILRARRHCRAPLPKPNVICARSLPAGPEADALIATLPPQVGRVVRAIADELVMAPVLGPLLKIEERLDREARDAFGTGQIEGTLSEGVSEDDAANVESLVLEMLAIIADQTTSTATQRLFAAEAHDAVRFVEAMARRYTTVLMNPPFGLCVFETQPYLQVGYEGWTDLFACFLERGSEFRESGGTTGILMPNTFFNTRKMRALRQTLIERRDLRYVLDLGAGVLEDAAVEVAALVLGISGQVLYVDAVDAPHDARADIARNFADLAEVSCPEDYVGGNYLLTFRRSSQNDDLTKTLDPSYALVRTGGNTFDNFRFIRLWWELDAVDSVSWPMYFKGGEFYPYSSAARLVLDWKNDGENLKELGAERGVLPQVMQSSTHWGKSGLRYPRAGKKFGARVMPPNGMFSEKSVAILPIDDGDALALLGLLNSAPTSQYFSEIGRGRFVENSWVKGVPIDAASFERLHEELDEETRTLVETFAAIDQIDETSPNFREFPDAVTAQTMVSEAIERAMVSQAKLDALAADIVHRPNDSGHPAEVAAALHYLGNSEDLAFRAVSFEVGRCFGRWVGDDIAPAVYLQQPGSDRDLAGAVSAGLADSGFAETLATLGCDDFLGRGGISGFVASKFFRRHLTMYSMSRRKAPIYWQLQVQSRTWGLWLYLPRLNREMLYAIVGETEQRQRVAEQRIATLQREYHDGGVGRTIAAVSKELDAEQKLAVELVAFRDEAERIANLGWEPDLDDGAVLNAAPLASLFPAWKDAAKYRKELKQGKHAWSTVSTYADQL